MRTIIFINRVLVDSNRCDCHSLPQGGTTVLKTCQGPVSWSRYLWLLCRTGLLTSVRLSDLRGPWFYSKKISRSSVNRLLETGLTSDLKLWRPLDSETTDFWGMLDISVPALRNYQTMHNNVCIHPPGPMKLSTRIKLQETQSVCRLFRMLMWKRIINTTSKVFFVAFFLVEVHIMAELDSLPGKEVFAWMNMHLCVCVCVCVSVCVCVQTGRCESFSSN